MWAKTLRARFSNFISNLALQHSFKWHFCPFLSQSRLSWYWVVGNMPIMSKQGLCHTSSSVLPWLGGILLCWMSWYRTAFCLLRRHRTGSGVGLLCDPPLPKGGLVLRWSCLCWKCDGYEFVFLRMHITRRGTLGAKCKRTILFIHLQTKLWLSNLIRLSLSCCVYPRLCYNVFSLSDDDKRMVCDLCKGYFFFFSYITYDFTWHQLQ